MKKLEVLEAPRKCATGAGGGSSVLHSHWTRSFETWLSLVERIIVLLAPALLCHKEPAWVSITKRIIGFHARKITIIGALMSKRTSVFREIWMPELVLCIWHKIAGASITGEALDK